jgi:hypothetical protein
MRHFFLVVVAAVAVAVVATPPLWETLHETAGCSPTTIEALRVADVVQTRRAEHWRNSSDAQCVAARARRLDEARRRVEGDWWTLTKARGEREGWWHCTSEGPSCVVRVATGGFVMLATPEPTVHRYAASDVSTLAYADGEMQTTMSCQALAAECRALAAECRTDASVWEPLAIVVRHVRATVHAAVTTVEHAVGVDVTASTVPLRGSVEDGWRMMRETVAEARTWHPAGTIADVYDDVPRSVRYEPRATTLAEDLYEWYAGIHLRCLMPWHVYATRIMHLGYASSSSSSPTPKTADKPATATKTGANIEL